MFMLIVKAHELREVERLVRKHRRSLIANPGERVTNVASTADNLIVELADGRSISVPLAWYPRLLHASQDDRDHWEVAGAGFGIHWPAIDEDLSVEGLLRGAPAPRVRVVSS
jgi:hypothetical protein